MYNIIILYYEEYIKLSVITGKSMIKSIYVKCCYSVQLEILEMQSKLLLEQTKEMYKEMNIGC